MSTEVQETLQRHRIIPVVTISSNEVAEPLLDALQQGGLPIAEITLRTRHAYDAIQLAANRTDFLVGAGTVINAEQCQRVIDCGASFVVSPGFDPGVVEVCLTRQIPCIPGFATATELQALIGLGLRVAKFFPAEPLGGKPMLKSLAGPFPFMKFVPTGGVNANNLEAWLAMPQVVAVGGSWMVKDSLFAGGDYTSVVQATADAVKIAKRNQPS